MLKLSRVCLLIFMITAIGLCWVGQQVELVTTSYQIAQKERELMELTWARSHLEYRVLTLESPTQLDYRLNQADRKLSFRDPTRVVGVRQPMQEENQSYLAKKQKIGFLEFFIHSAEAKQPQK